MDKKSYCKIEVNNPCVLRLYSIGSIFTDPVCAVSWLVRLSPMLSVW